MDKALDRGVKSKKSRDFILVGLIVACVFMALLINLYWQQEVLYTHAYYIPVILAGVWYNRKGVAVAALLGGCHILISFLHQGEFSYTSLIRFFSLVLAGYLVGSISEERDRAQKSLKESEKRLEDIINFLPDPTFAINREGQIIVWNQAMEKISGARASSVMGKGNYEHSLPFYGIRRPVLLDLVIKPRKEVQEGYLFYRDEEGGSIIGESFCPAVGESGKYFWLKAAPLFNRDNELVGAIESVRDITSQKLAQERLLDHTAEIERKNRELENLYARLREDVEKARHIHQHTLTRQFPYMEGLNFAACYQPAALVGGDLYDVVRAGDKLVIYLADVSGHGLDGAMLSIFIKNTIRNYISMGYGREGWLTPRNILRYLADQYYQEEFPEEYFICISLAVFDGSNCLITYTGAGFQYPPLVFVQGRGPLELSCRELPISYLVPPGIMKYRENTLELTSPFTIFLTTDGLAEEEREGVIYWEKLVKVFRDNYSLPPQVIVDKVVQDFKYFQGGVPARDDVTILVVQGKGSKGHD